MVTALLVLQALTAVLEYAKAQTSTSSPPCILTHDSDNFETAACWIFDETHWNLC